jgi:DNA-binding transcriptional LysR family regulator
MERGDASDLLAFLAVARERSFTRAAARLAISQPTLSQTVQGLEERLGVRLLNRTTRSVTPTQAGERLLHKIGPKFDEMDAELGALRELREKPAGTIRITATEYAAQAACSEIRRRWISRSPWVIGLGSGQETFK